MKPVKLVLALGILVGAVAMMRGYRWGAIVTVLAGIASLVV